MNIRGYNLAYVEEVEFRFHGSSGGSPVRRWLCAPSIQINTRLSARCEGPFGLLRGGLEVLLRGSCFNPVTVTCHSDQWRPFEALAGHRKRYEAMPVSAVLERAFAYREVAGSCRLVCRERGDLVLHADLPRSGAFGLSQVGSDRAGRLDVGPSLMVSAESLLSESDVHFCVREGLARLRLHLRTLDREASTSEPKACECASKVSL